MIENKKHDPFLSNECEKNLATTIVQSCWNDSESYKEVVEVSDKIAKILDGVSSEIAFTALTIVGSITLKQAMQKKEENGISTN